MSVVIGLVVVAAAGGAIYLFRARIKAWIDAEVAAVKAKVDADVAAVKARIAKLEAVPAKS